MARFSAAALNEALDQLMGLQFRTTTQSWVEVFLAARRLVARGEAATTPTVDAAVRDLFALVPDHPNGRIRAFRDSRNPWASLHDTGRSTVWNMATRRAPSTAMFDDSHIKNGLHPDATEIFVDGLLDATGRKLPLQPLAVLCLRERDWRAEPSVDDLRSELADFLALDPAELDMFTEEVRFRSPILGPPEWSAETVSAAFPLPDNPIESDKPEAPVAPPVSGNASLVLDERTKRMVRLAIASSTAVLLVGPPGTGKTDLLHEVLTEIADDPNRFGFESPVEWDVATPEEDWTFDKLVIGHSVVEGKIVLEPGLVPQAIRNGQWLVLDEMNRADMDRIFGGLLTWLSKKRVKIGDRTDATGSIYLDWAETPDGRVEDPDEQAGDITYVAGREWRLLGTYNALDAQKVFRLGQALGRRFKHVPIPPASSEQFERVVRDRCDEVGADESVASITTALYAAHQANDDTKLGPALFLDIPAYVAAGTRLDALAGSDATTADLVAEAYVANVGHLVAKLEDVEIAQLRTAAVGLGGLDDAEWDWIVAQLASLRA